jgi:uncharacterized protein YkwD
MPKPRSARHRARRSPARHARWAVPLLAVLTATGFYLTHGSSPRPGDATSRAGATRCSTGQEALVSSTAPCPNPAVSQPAVQDGHGATRHGLAQGSLRSGQQPGSSSSAGLPTSSPSPSASPSSNSPTHSPSPTPAPPGSTGAPQGAAAQVLVMINQARKDAGLPPYILSTGLDNAAVGHDLKMANGCGLSHQCKAEYGLGGRETHAGVHWTQAGENIGEAGPVTSQAGITAQAVGLTQKMLNETPPGDGHLENILSRSFRYVGIAVTEDSTGTVWMTQDFSG